MGSAGARARALRDKDSGISKSWRTGCTILVLYHGVLTPPRHYLYPMVAVGDEL